MSLDIARAPWPPDFPHVFVHGDLPTRNRHPSFAIAKAGDANAAISLVRDLLSDAVTDRLKTMLEARRPFVVPVSAIEDTGFNAIPDAMAQEIGSRLGIKPISGQILQTNRVALTRADGWHRLATPATFAGDVVAGSDYLLVDDHVGFGGTFANLRGHIERAGGHVVGMTALTETGGAREIAISRKLCPCYVRDMDADSKNSGIGTSATTSTALPGSKEVTYVVSNPLTQSELDWLRRQSERVGEAFRLSGFDQAVSSRR